MLLFNACSDEREFTLPRERMGRGWKLELCTADADGRGRERPLRGAHALVEPSILALDAWCLQAGASLSGGEDRASRHLSSAADARVRLRSARRELMPYLRDLGISHLYLSPSLQARHESTHGYDVIDPTPAFGRARRERGFPARWRPSARARAWGSCSTSFPTTWPRTRRTASGPTRRCARAVLRHRPGDRPVPALLRHRRAGRGPPGGPARCSRRPTRLILELVARASIDGLRIDHPDGLADPAGYLRGFTTAALGASGWRRSSTPTSGCATGRCRGTVGYEFLNEVLRPVRRPRRRGRR